jgi:hypothetical protein
MRFQALTSVNRWIGSDPAASNFRVTTTMMEEAGSSESSVRFYQLQGVTSQRTVTFNIHLVQHWIRVLTVDTNTQHKPV